MKQIVTYAIIWLQTKSKETTSVNSFYLKEAQIATNQWGRLLVANVWITTVGSMEKGKLF
jgi:hypothetical protein